MGCGWGESLYVYVPIHFPGFKWIKKGFYCLGNVFSEALVEVRYNWYFHLNIAILHALIVLYTK